MKTSHHVDFDRGIDGNKKIKGRKEHIIVDTLGLPLAIAIHEANLHDSKGSSTSHKKLAYKFPRLVKILTDGGYMEGLADWVKKKFGWILEVVFRPDECPSKFQMLPNYFEKCIFAFNIFILATISHHSLFNKQFTPM